MGEARRRKATGNTETNPNWRRKLTSEEIREAVTKGVKKGISDVQHAWNDMNKRRD